MFEPFPLGLGGGRRSDRHVLSVIRRWHYRDHFSIREISRRTGLSRNTVRKYLRSDTVEPKSNIPDRPSKLDPYADKLSQMLRQEAGKSRKQKRTTKQLHADLAALVTTAHTIAWRPSLATGRLLGNRNRRRAAACSCRLRFCRARRSSSTGRKIGRSSPASGPSCRSLTSSSPTAAPSFSAPILSRPMRCPQPRLPRMGGRAAAGFSHARRSVGVGGWNARIYPAYGGTIVRPWP